MTARPHLPRTVLRGIGAVLLATQGWVHLRLWADGFSNIPVIGPLFLVGALSAFALAIAVLATRGPLAPIAGILLSLGQVGAFAVSTTVGLFGIQSQWTWTGIEGAALWSELLAALVLLVVVRWRQAAVVTAS